MMWRRSLLGLALGAACVFATTAPSRAGDVLEALVAAYPDHLAGRDGDVLVWRDGTRMPIDDGRDKSHQERLEGADIEDMLSQAYPVGACSYAPPARNFDPGRIRNEAFFRKMYGATKGEARANLTSVDWFGRRLRVTTVNGVDKALVAVSGDLAALEPRFRKFFTTSGGTFNWRVIAGTDRLSVHSFGAAIDINTKYADYWRWQGGRPGNVEAYRNQVPEEIVEVFESHGFIWGGKWYHYDTMHFEYRPELLAMAARCE